MRIVSALILLWGMTAAANGAPEPTQDDTPAAALKQFLADARARREDAVRARLFVPGGEAGREEVDDLLEVVADGTFAALELRVLEVREEGDAAVAAVEFRRSGRRPDVDPMYLLREAGRWKVVPSSDPVSKFDSLTDAQKQQLGELAEWFGRQEDGFRRAAADSPDAAAAEAQRKLNTGLALAATKGDVAAVERLIKEGADVNGDAYALGSPLKAVVDRGKLDMIRLLVERGADVNAPGEPLLFGAIGHGKTETVRLLVELGADVNRSHDRDTALGLAARLGRADVVKLLLDAKADPAPPKGMGGPVRQTTLLNLAASSGDMATFELVRPHYPDLTVTDGAGRNALHAVAHPFAFAEGKDHAAIVAALLEAGVDPHAKMREAEPGESDAFPLDTPLRLAARSGRPAVVDAFLQQVKYEPAELSLVLPLVVSRQFPPRTVELMLDGGADPNAPANVTQRTALHEAVARSSAETVKLLLGRGADPSLKDAEGADALALARIRVEKGRQSSIAGKYLPEFENAPDAGAKILELVRRAAADGQGD